MTETPKCNTRRPYKIRYTSQKKKAWRNMIVATVNAGLKQGHFTLEPGGNFWPGYQPGDGKSDANAGDGAHYYTFDFPGGMPVQAYVKDAGYDELSIHVALYPTGKFMGCINAGYLAGDAYANGWLERRSSLWLQSASIFKCCKHLLRAVAEIEIEPEGYEA